MNVVAVDKMKNIFFKGTVHPKIKMTHIQAMQDVDEFVSSSDLEKCSIACSAMDPLQ